MAKHGLSLLWWKYREGSTHPNNFEQVLKMSDDDLIAQRRFIIETIGQAIMFMEENEF